MKKLFPLFILLLLPFFSFLSLGQNNILQHHNHLKFIENKQQWKENFLFKAGIPNGNLFLENNRLVYNFYDGATFGELMADLHDHGSTHHNEDEDHNDSIACHAFSVSFVNANPRPVVKGKQPFTETRNYFYGDIKATDVQAFQKIVYNNLFDKTDLHIFQYGNSLKYEFHLAPHAKPSQIKLQYDSIVDILINDDESLRIKTSLNEVIEQKPYAYQIIDGTTKEISCRFVLKDNVLSYKLGHYNHKYPLVIDPQLIFSTYSGSESDNWGNTACLDQTGNLYTGGTVFNQVVNGFPTTLGAFQTTFQGGDTDIGILKFDSSGTQLLYATYIGGNNSEIPTSLITDDNEDLYILSMTGSNNFPTSNNAYQQQFKGNISEGIWLVNGQTVSTNSTTFSTNTLKEGDQIQMIFNHHFCPNTATNQVDSSNIITIQPKTLTATLTGSHKNFCNGDSIHFSTSHSYITSPQYEWFINGISIGNNDSSFFSKNLQNGDIIQYKVTDNTCQSSILSNEWIVEEVSGQDLSIPLISSPEIVCSNGVYTFSIDSLLVGSNSSILWKNGKDTIGSTYTFIKLAALNDSIHAIISSSLACLANNSLTSDTIIVDDLQSISPSVSIPPAYIDNCGDFLVIHLETEYAGIGTEYQWFLDNVLINTSFSPTFYQSSNALAGEYKVVMNSTLGCIQNTAQDSSVINKSSFLSISESTTNSICLNNNITFTSNVDDIFFNTSDSLEPVGGYFFTQGTDIAVIKLNKTGNNILASTLIGGRSNDGILDTLSNLNNNYGDILRGDINVDKEGNVYISSVSQSIDFPIKSAIQPTYGGGKSDGVAFKLNADFSDLIWSTYLGGSNDDALYSIQIDSNNSVYVAGGTLSNDIPITSGSFQTTHQGDVDAMISKISPDGQSLLASTLLGTSQYDQAYFIQLDDDNDIYVLGQTKGNMPILPDSSIYHQKNAGLFVTKFTNNLDQIIYSTTLGDTISTDAIIPNISPTAFLVNECENIFISGWGGLTNYYYNGGFTVHLPLTDNAFQPTTDESDFYMMVVQKDLNQLLYATYFGGDKSREHVDGGTSRFDEKGIVYQSVCAGCGGNDDFPLFPPLDSNPNTYPKANNATTNGSCNNGVIKFDLALLKAGLDIKVLCDNRIEFNNLSVGGVDFQWDFGDGKDTLTLTNDNFVHEYDTAGTYTVKLTARDITTCTAIDIVTEIATVPNQIGKEATDTLCLGESVTLTPTLKPNATYKWSPDDFITTSTDSIVSITPTNNISYLVSIIDSFQCEQVDTFNIFALNRLSADFSLPSECVAKEKVEMKNQSENGATFNWNFGDGTSATTTDSLLFHDFPTSNLFYTIQLIASNPNTCNLSDSLQQDIYISNPVNAQKITDSLCLGEEITIVPSIKEKATYEWFPSDFIDNITDSTITIAPQQSIAYLVSITDSNQCLQVDTIVIKVKNYQPNIEHKVLGSCVEFPNVEFVTGLQPPVEYTWSFGDGNVSFEPQPVHTFEKYGNFTVQVSVTDGQCSAHDTTELILEPLYVPNIITPNQDGVNDELVIKGIENNGNWYLEIYNRWGDEIYRHEYYDNSWTGDYLEDGTYYYLLTAPDETTCKGWIQITR